MTIMDNGFPSRCNRGIRGGQSDFKYLTRTCGHASLQSRRERGPEGSTHLRRVNPTTGDKKPHESGPPIRYGTLRAANPTTKPLTHIQVGESHPGGAARVGERVGRASGIAAHQNLWSTLIVGGGSIGRRQDRKRP